MTHCYVQIPNSLEYHFKAATTEEEEGVFQQTVNQYLTDIGVKYVEEEETVGYTLDYSIIGLPYTIKGTISLPTAKDLVYLYIITYSDLHDLKQTINLCDGLLIKYDYAALWKTLPQWLKATITTIQTLGTQMVWITVIAMR